MHLYLPTNKSMLENESTYLSTRSYPRFWILHFQILNVSDAYSYVAKTLLPPATVSYVLVI